MDVREPANEVTPTGIEAIEGLDVTKNATISGSLNVGGGTLIEGILNVIDSITTNNIVVTGWADFFHKVIFRDDVTFFGRPTFNKDTAGNVTIPKGQRSVEVIFTQDYHTMPVVVISVSLEELKTEAAQKKMEQYLATHDITGAVVKRSLKGFTILLNKPQTEDITFSWVAVAVADVSPVTVAPTASPSATPILSPTP